VEEEAHVGEMAPIWPWWLLVRPLNHTLIIPSPQVYRTDICIEQQRKDELGKGTI
jgi:hypothetical protein